MKFSTLIKSAFAVLAFTQTAIAVSLPMLTLSNRLLTNPQCSGVDQDCCWNDMDGCVNQHGQFGTTPCAQKSYREDFCENWGINCVGVSKVLALGIRCANISYRMVQTAVLSALDKQELAHRRLLVVLFWVSALNSLMTQMRWTVLGAWKPFSSLDITTMKPCCT